MKVKSLVMGSLLVLGMSGAQAATSASGDLGKDAPANAGIKSSTTVDSPNSAGQTGTGTSTTGNGSTSSSTSTRGTTGTSTSPGTGSTSSPGTSSGSGAAGGSSASGGK